MIEFVEFKGPYRVALKTDAPDYFGVSSLVARDFGFTDQEQVALDKVMEFLKRMREGLKLESIGIIGSGRLRAQHTHQLSIMLLTPVGGRELRESGALDVVIALEGGLSRQLNQHKVAICFMNTGKKGGDRVKDELLWNLANDPQTRFVAFTNSI